MQSNILPKKFLIKDKYEVLFFIKQGAYAQSYRVKDNNGKLYFLKLFNISKLHRTSFDNERKPLRNTFS